jgi:transcriptional regulator with XRE-family HTH domain
VKTINLLAGAKIKVMRKKLGLNPRKLGLLLGCTVQQIQHYEKGFCQMPIYKLNNFAKLCNVPIDWFLLDEYSMLVYVGDIQSNIQAVISRKCEVIVRQVSKPRKTN